MHKFLPLFMVCSLAMSDLIAQDWPNLARFKDDNQQLGSPAPGEHRIVLIGNSITEGWSKASPRFFQEHALINRGISGQTTPQMLLRFRQDVIDLNPATVFILGGINDIAGNTGPSTVKMIMDNIESMSVLADAAGIKVMLCSVLPCSRLPWRGNANPSETVKELNGKIKAFAELNGFVYVDYYLPLADEEGGLPEKYSSDGVHPNAAGYWVMEEVILRYLK